MPPRRPTLRPTAPTVLPVLPVLLLALLTLACSGGRPKARTTRVGAWQVTEALGPETGASGLSGLARAPDGTLWAVPERRRDLLTVQIRKSRLALHDVEVVGVPEDPTRLLDTESLAFLGPDHLVLGTERHSPGRPSDTLLEIRRQGKKFHVVDSWELPYALWGTEAADNRGIEGLCSAGGLVLAAVEQALEHEGHRDAPVAVWDLQRKVWSPLRFRLTTPTGMASSLTCRKDGDDLEVWLLERHYGVARILHARIPLQGPPAEVATEVVLDLVPVAGARNYEGLEPLPDGGWALLVDRNTGPAEWLELRPAPTPADPSRHGHQ